MPKHEIKFFPSNPSLEGFARLMPDIVYSCADGVEKKLTLIRPWGLDGNDALRCPLVVFVQGSAWTTPDLNAELPQLSELARRGYVVATVSHRSATDGWAFPAYLQDVKTAIRFLRANAEKYGLDPARVAIYGTSSGGNTALLAGVTGDDPAYRTEEYADQSDQVQLVVDCFGPANVERMFKPELYEAVEWVRPIVLGLCGDLTNEARVKQVLHAMSPALLLKKAKTYPPFLLLHGDADDVVPFEQSVEMLDALEQAGADARLIRVEGAPHEGSFWSRPLVEEIYAFIEEKL